MRNASATWTVDRVRKYNERVKPSTGGPNKYAHIFDVDTMTSRMSLQEVIDADLLVSADAKVSTLAKVEHRVTDRGNEKSEKAVISNAFGMMFGDAFGCRGTATSACESVCYVGGTLRYDDPLGVLLFNYVIVSTLSTEELWQHLVVKFVKMMKASRDQQRRRGITSPLFRFNWSGDVLNEWHARAIAEACAQVDGIDAWIYTRNFFALPHLVGVDSLRVLFSADKENAAIVDSVRDLFDGVQVAWMDDDAERVYEKRAMKCPATRMGNVVPISKKSNVQLRNRDGEPIDTMQGVCAQCRACVNLKVTPDIIFTLH